MDRNLAVQRYGAGSHIIFVTCGSIHFSATYSQKAITDMFNRYFWSVSVCSQGYLKMTNTYKYGPLNIRVCDCLKWCLG